MSFLHEALLEVVITRANYRYRPDVTEYTVDFHEPLLDKGDVEHIGLCGIYFQPVISNLVKWDKKEAVGISTYRDSIHY